MTQPSPADLAPRTVHLDTSVQIERRKIARRRARVEEALRGFRWKTTSSFAKLEFKQAWVRDLAYLHRESARHTSIPELLDGILSAFATNPQQRNRLSRVVQAISSYLELLPGGTTMASAVARMRAHLEIAVLGCYPWWVESVDQEFDGTGCCRAQEAPKRSRSGCLDTAIARCDAGRVNCDVAGFFQANQSAFARIAEAVEAMNNMAGSALRRFAEVIRQALCDPTILQDGKGCQAIADCIIAVDGLAMECFAAHNPLDWPTIADALGKPLLDPVVESDRSGSSDA